MGEALRLVLGLLSAICIGYCLIALLKRQSQFPFYFVLSLSYLLGVGVVVFVLFVLDIFGIRFNFFSPLVFCTPFCLYILIRKRPLPRLIPEFSVLKGLRIFEILLISLIAYRMLYVLFQSLLIPIYSWDAFATWAYRAKAFYFEGVMDFSKGALSYPHASYPNLIPLLECWLYNAMGTFDDRIVKIIFPLFFISLLGISYFFMRSFTNRVYSFIGIYIISAMPFLIYHSTISYSDVTLMTYNVLSVMAVVLWIEKNERFYLFIGGFAAGLAAFTKLEGTAYMGITSVLLFAYLLKDRWTKYVHMYAEKNKRALFSAFTSSVKEFLAFFIPASIIGLSYMVFKRAMGIPNERMQIDFALSSLQRIPNIIKYFGLNMLSKGSWNIVWFMLGLSVLFNLKKFRDIKYLFLIAVFCSYLLLYGSLFLFTTNYEFLAVGTLLNRSFLQIIPFPVLLIIASFFSDKTKK